MGTYKLYKSDKKNKKYTIITPKNKKIHFGDSRYSDYTIHKDILRKNMYIMRHSKNENWNNKNSAGFWSRWVLWNKPTLIESIRDIENRFNIKIIM
jgi:acid phosphatase class B